MRQAHQSLVLPIPTQLLRKMLLWLVVLIGTLLVVAIFAVLGYQIYFLERAYPGVKVNGVDATGLNHVELYELVNHQAQQLQARRLELVSLEGNWTYAASALGARIDVDRTVTQAFAAGRSGVLWRDVQTQFRLLQYSRDVPLVTTFDTGPANQVLAQIATQIDRPLHEAELFITDANQITVTPAQQGRQLDIDVSRDAIREAILHPREEPVALTVHYSDPIITNAHLVSAQLNQLVQQPVTFRFQNQDWTLQGDELFKALVIGKRYPEMGRAEISVQLERAALRPFFVQIAEQINQQPRDARFEFNPVTGMLVPILESQDGYELDVEAALDALVTYVTDLRRAEITLPVLTIDPVVSSANPQSLGLTQLISSNTSYFKGSSAERMQNIEVAAARFHGLVLPPGEVFSFNEYLGPVTAEQGFVEGLIIAGDRTAVGIGGGVCQVSTTVFRAALYGGFELVERWAHGYRVGWYETNAGPGLDATIFSPHVDFKFRNDSESYILIQVRTDLAAGTLTFDFYGRSLDRLVSVSEPVITSIVPHGAPIYEEDPTLASGEVQQVEWAKDGQDVEVQRVVTRSDGTVLHRDTIFSRYKAWPARYRVGNLPQTGLSEAGDTSLGP